MAGEASRCAEGRGGSASPRMSCDVATGAATRALAWRERGGQRIKRRGQRRRCSLTDVRPAPAPCVSGRRRADVLLSPLLSLQPGRSLCGTASRRRGRRGRMTCSLAGLPGNLPDQHAVLREDIRSKPRSPLSVAVANSITSRRQAVVAHPCCASPHVPFPAPAVRSTNRDAFGDGHRHVPHSITGHDRDVSVGKRTVNRSFTCGGRPRVAPRRTHEVVKRRWSELSSERGVWKRRPKGLRSPSSPV